MLATLSHDCDIKYTCLVTNNILLTVIIIFDCVLSFKKMISEEQQGVIVCHVLEDLISESELFGGPTVTNVDTMVFENFCKSRLKSIEEWYVIVIIVPYSRERGLTTECWPTPHFGLNFLPRSSVYSNMRPCVAALRKRSSNGWFMRTELRIVYVRSILNLLNGCKTNPS